MIVTEKRRDEDWGHKFYMAKATKMHVITTGNTRMQALMNLKHEMRKHEK
jgi:hypothetical protein